MASRVTVILGGAASGKSAFAEQTCVSTGKNRIYWATSQILDPEMQDKVDRHLAQRGGDWTTIEDPLDVAAVASQLSGGDVLLMECATMWLSNHLFADHDLAAETDALLAAFAACPAEIVVVTNETGLGIVPENAVARRFREAQGRFNIALSARADCVVLVAAGLPLVLKGAL
ncbi:bifunctional adenosylcobinamide kinase/adenosylcobinamide-phosphate guanylyltransferase [Phaeobacter sp. B1627]|uniref:bifunctional adenosylcobinamide kinase/adenosylcobinamide-phosphate guanylyltransferase n=1 Tax=Phaeobacter sp. B1627 TaxID=2583809 RepID=UPI00111964E2|nr:bifunctional adenosylcobinamide kinase/adenosylcobinamide-phosphate guanylyltransferase [Phaeobacter sp. B1627]TNJ44822.1 bifunctional adenosylcobinamide kinase/adenosylcobinamide-phosphate guanylyltransferase [Phaeobacter sp. B1627]